MADACITFPADSMYIGPGYIWDSAFDSTISVYDGFAGFNDLATINAAGAETFFDVGTTILPADTPGIVATYTMEIDCDCAGQCPGTLVIDASSDAYGLGNRPSPEAAGLYSSASVPLTINCVPEPATALLLIGAIPFLRRRR
jgi:hypothetical protein